MKVNQNELNSSDVLLIAGISHSQEKKQTSGNVEEKPNREINGIELRRLLWQIASTESLQKTTISWDLKEKGFVLLTQSDWEKKA